MNGKPTAPAGAPGHDGHAALTVRRMAFRLDPQEIPRHWNGGNAVRTHAYNAGSAVFEVGEKFFVDVMQQFAARLPDSPLRAHVRGFIGQEANHRRVHVQYNRMLAAQGYEIGPAQRPLARFAAWQLRRQSLRTQLAFVAAYEHFTTLLSVHSLTDARWLDGACDEMKLLWSWHTLEEIEHRSVAMDAYHAAGGGYWRRVLVMPPAAAVLLGGVLVALWHLMRGDGLLRSPRTWWQAFRFALVSPGFAWRGLPGVLRYFAPRFHPARHHEGRLGQEWLPRLARHLGAAVPPPAPARARAAPDPFPLPPAAAPRHHAPEAHRTRGP